MPIILTEEKEKEKEKGKEGGGGGRRRRREGGLEDLSVRAQKNAQTHTFMDGGGNE